MRVNETMRGSSGFSGCCCGVSSSIGGGASMALSSSFSDDDCQRDTLLGSVIRRAKCGLLVNAVRGAMQHHAKSKVLSVREGDTIVMKRCCQVVGCRG